MTAEDCKYKEAIEFLQFCRSMWPEFQFVYYAYYKTEGKLWGLMLCSVIEVLVHTQNTSLFMNVPFNFIFLYKLLIVLKLKKHMINFLMEVF
jgi:hypothetical protein